MNFGQDTQREGNTQKTDINECTLLKWITKDTMCDDIDGILLVQYTDYYYKNLVNMVMNHWVP
jgi:hypothetical protein